MDIILSHPMNLPDAVLCKLLDWINLANLSLPNTAGECMRQTYNGWDRGMFCTLSKICDGASFWKY